MQTRFVADAHCDFLAQTVWKHASLDRAVEGQHLSLERLEQGGVKMQCFAIFPGGPDEVDPWTQACQQREAYERMLAEHPQLVRGAAPLERLQPGQIAAVLTLEGASALGDSLDRLQTVADWGVRILTLTWNHRNALACGVGEQQPPFGLTTLGVQALERMAQLGIVADVSHLHPDGFWQVMERAPGKVMASHSNLKTLCGHRRNLTREQTQALIDRGGFIGINFCGNFLRDDGRATLEDVVRHILAFLELGAGDILGLGTDFDGIDNPPVGLEHPGKLPDLFEALAKAGVDDAQLDKIAYGNLARILAEAEKERS
ncbi:MAG: dipeptidase [Christensenellales bacterium]|jgi:membrane dipeptidase